MNKKLIILILVSLFLNYAALLEAQELVPYENQELGVSFSYAKAWERIKYGNNVSVFSNRTLLTEKGEGAGLIVSVDAAENSNISTVPKTEEELWEQLKQRDPNLKEITKLYKEWLGNQWLFVKYTSPDYKIKGYCYLRLSEEKIYIVHYFYHSAESEAKYKTAIEQILDSLRFFEPQQQK